MKMLSKYIKLSILIFGMLNSTSVLGQNTVIDKAVAQIGDEIILLSDIQKAKLQMIQEGMEVSSKDDA